MDLSFIDTRSALTILHLIGVVIGAGGAIASDFMFFSSVKDERISHTEMRFLKLGSKMVWLGLSILFISGGLIFLGDVARYSVSTKFLAKMTIVGIITINGILFHIFHIPHLHRHAGTHFPSSDEFTRKLPVLVASGVVSMVSWMSALVLGSLHSIPYSYLSIMSLYFFALIIGITVGVLHIGRSIPTDHRRKE
jgi:hypothetical protein